MPDLPRLKVQGSLATLAAVYPDHTPRVNVAGDPRKPMPRKGAAVIVFDAAGNEVEAEVVGVEYVVAPSLGTLRNPRLEARQTTFGEAA